MLENAAPRNQEGATNEPEGPIKEMTQPTNKSQGDEQQPERRAEGEAGQNGGAQPGGERLPEPAPESPRFAAVLTPHQSLSPRGFLVLMGAIASLSFLMGLFFYSIGAWPITGFFGLDVLLVYLAFRLNFRAARRFELVELRSSELIVRKISPSGEERRWTFNPYWVRVQVEENARGGHILRLTSHGRGLAIGDFLTLEEKRDFAAALRQALAENGRM